jgi:hypothetical protein
MVGFGRVLSAGSLALLLVMGSATSTLGLVAGGGISSFGGESRGVTQVTGSVVCVGCSLEEARAANPQMRGLYQLAHPQGQVVMTVTAVNEPQLWHSVVWPRRVWVRATDQIFQGLTAEEHLFKEIELTGLLSNGRTLDLFDVTIDGLGTEARAQATLERSMTAAQQKAEAAAQQAGSAAGRAETAAARAESAAEQADQATRRIEAMVEKLDGGFPRL